MKIFLVHSPIDSEATDVLFTETKSLRPSGTADSEVGGTNFGPNLSITPPLWLISLGSYLKSYNPDSRLTLIDGQFSKNAEIIALIRKDRPDVVGIRPILFSFQNSLKIAREAKKIGARVIMGGPHAAGLAREILQNRGPYSNDYCVDAICQHDGDRAFYDFAQGKPLKVIPNLIYQASSGIKSNRISALDLNALPMPDYELIEVERYFSEQKKGHPFLKSLRVYSSQGCHWRTASHKGCLFCPQIYREHRLKSPARFWSEIDLLARKYNLDAVRDTGEDFLANKKWVLELFNQSKSRNTWPEFSIYARADRISPEVALTLKKLKVSYVFIGLESGDQSSLDKLGKGCSPALGLKAVKSLTDKGIKVIASFVLGAPGETEESFSRTLKFARRLSKSRLVFIFPNVLQPFPNTAALKLLTKATGKKYFNKDSFDHHELLRDWAKYFCQISYGEIKEFCAEMANLNRNL